MEKRVLLAVSLSFVVLVLYQAFFVKPVPQRGRPPAAAPAGVSSAPPGGPAPAGGPSTSPAAEPSVAPGLPAAAAVVSDTEERDVTVEGPAVRAVFSTRGAELKKWELKRYFDDAGKPVDLIPAVTKPAGTRAFALVADDDPQLTRQLAEALFRPSAAKVDLGSGTPELVFDYEDASGLEARKVFRFGVAGHPYVVEFSATVARRGQLVPVAMSSGPGIGDTARAVQSTSFLSPSYYQQPEGIVQRGSKVTRLPASELVKQPVQEGTFTAIGADDHYFLGALLPGDRNTRVTYETLGAETAAGPRNLVRYRARVAGGLQDVRVFLGPKQYDLLASTNRELVRTINFGIFDWLVVPLLQALNWIDRYIGNFGWSIIVLTLLINAVIAPLRHRSVVSMRKMQELQPQVKAIQDRYANLKTTDPARQKMNTEMMNLYREKGVNPASGCIPLVLTMPVLFAFYSMLSQAIELRGAPFMGWISDLSKHDPYYITPLLMGASMVWQQRMTPSTADPVQQKMMMFMPVMFTFMFLWAPSGLVLYWLISNVWAIGQQIVTNRIIGPPRPAAARAEPRGKSESGRTEPAR